MQKNLKFQTEKDKFKGLLWFLKAPITVVFKYKADLCFWTAQMQFYQPFEN